MSFKLGEQGQGALGSRANSRELPAEPGTDAGMTRLALEHLIQARTDLGPVAIDVNLQLSHGNLPGK